MKIINKEKEKYENIHYQSDYGLGNRQVNELKNMSFDFSHKFKEIISKSKNCLDIACGGGTVMGYVDSIGCTPTGIDISPSAIGKVNPKYKTYIGSCHKLPFKNNEFDVVYFLDGMEHIPTEIENESISESFRVSKNYVCHGIAMCSSIRKGIELHVNIKTSEKWKEIIDSIAQKFGFSSILYYIRNETVYLIYKK